MVNFNLTSPLQIVAFFCLTVLLTKWFWSKRYHYLLSMKMSGPFSIPFVGSVFYGLKMYKDGTPLRVLMQGNKEYKGFYRIWLGTGFYVIAFKPEDVESIFCTHVQNKPPVALGHWVDFMGNGLLTMSDVSKDNKWKTHKKIVNPSFGGNMLKSYYHHVRANCVHLEKEIAKISNKGFVDFGWQMLRFCCDSVSESMYGIEFKFREGNRDELLLAVETMTDTVVRRIVHCWLLIEPIYGITNMAKKQRAATQKIREFGREVFDLKTKFNNNNINAMYPENATMKLLLDAYESGSISEGEVIEEIMNLWNAASDTVGIVSQFVFLSLAMNKRCQDKVFEEIKEFCGDDENAIVEYEDLSRFPYTEMCIKETLRFFSPGPIALRHNSNPFVFKSRNLNIPADTTFIYSSFITHRDPEIWQNPEEFIPERFAPEECAKRHPYAFAPFSGGPRKCGGRAFAMMLLKTCVIHIIRKYEFICEWKMKDLSLSLDIDVRSKEGYKAHITERNWR